MNKSFPLRSGVPAYPCHWEAGPTRPARHDAYQVRHELQERGYYSIRFVGARPPHFRVKACRGGERFVLHVNFYGRITERDAIGHATVIGGLGDTTATITAGGAAGLPMHLTATGKEQRRSLVLILHDASKPPTTMVHDWAPKGLCKN